MPTTRPDIAQPRSVASAASTRPAPPRLDVYRPDPDRWKALAVVLAAGLMTLLRWHSCLPPIQWLASRD